MNGFRSDAFNDNRQMGWSSISRKICGNGIQLCYFYDRKLKVSFFCHLTVSLEYFEYLYCIVLYCIVLYLYCIEYSAI